ncbi:MAG TPA: hypothetical protein DEB39_16080 [Planctomycetaceae bacterium]|nr:hypothetical protein [Planctomycetaceae bacterium]
MPLSNLRILFVALLLCAFCSSRATYRDWALIDSMHRIREKSLVSPSESMLFESAMYGMTSGLEERGDYWSQFIPPQEIREIENEINNRIEGIGILFQYGKDNREYTVLYPIFDSPARRAGIRAGDAILAVDGVPIAGLPFQDVSGMIRGAPGSSVRLEVRHAGDEKTETLSVERDRVVPRSVLGDTLDSEGKPRFTLATHPEIAYLNMNAGFTDTTAEEVREALTHLPAEVEGLILDLRRNPGGYVDVCVEIADMFVKPTGKYKHIVLTRERNGRIRGRHTATTNTLFDKPIVVLIDGGSASASEILAACLQDFQRAKIVGTRSYGKGTVQETFDLPMRFGMLKLTDASYWRPSGRNINRSAGAPPTEEWGVGPDPGGDVSVSRIQAYASSRIRSFRANVPDADVEKLAAATVAHIRHHGKEILEEEDEILGDTSVETDDKTGVESGIETTSVGSGEEETTANRPLPDTHETNATNGNTVSSVPEPFTLKGSAPYYDLQLLKAIELLQKGTADTLETR